MWDGACELVAHCTAPSGVRMTSKGYISGLRLMLLLLLLPTLRLLAACKAVQASPELLGKPMSMLI